MFKFIEAEKIVSSLSSCKEINRFFQKKSTVFHQRSSGSSIAKIPPHCVKLVPILTNKRTESVSLTVKNTKPIFGSNSKIEYKIKNITKVENKKKDCKVSKNNMKKCLQITKLKNILSKSVKLVYVFMAFFEGFNKKLEKSNSVLKIVFFKIKEIESQNHQKDFQISQLQESFRINENKSNLKSDVREKKDMTELIKKLSGKKLKIIDPKNLQFGTFFILSSNLKKEIKIDKDSGLCNLIESPNQNLILFSENEKNLIDYRKKTLKKNIFEWSIDECMNYRFFNKIINKFVFYDFSCFFKLSKKNEKIKKIDFFISKIHEINFLMKKVKNSIHAYSLSINKSIFEEKLKWKITKEKILVHFQSKNKTIVDLAQIIDLNVFCMKISNFYQRRMKLENNQLCKKMTFLKICFTKKNRSDYLIENNHQLNFTKKAVLNHFESKIREISINNTFFVQKSFYLKKKSISEKKFTILKVEKNEVLKAKNLILIDSIRIIDRFYENKINFNTKLTTKHVISNLIVKKNNISKKYYQFFKTFSFSIFLKKEENKQKLNTLSNCHQIITQKSNFVLKDNHQIEQIQNPIFLNLSKRPIFEEKVQKTHHFKTQIFKSYFKHQKQQQKDNSIQKLSNPCCNITINLLAEKSIELKKVIAITEISIQTLQSKMNNISKELEKEIGNPSSITFLKEVNKNLQEQNNFLEKKLEAYSGNNSQKDIFYKNLEKNNLSLTEEINQINKTFLFQKTELEKTSQNACKYEKKLDFMLSFVKMLSTEIFALSKENFSSFFSKSSSIKVFEESYKKMIDLFQESIKGMYDIKIKYMSNKSVDNQNEQFSIGTCNFLICQFLNDFETIANEKKKTVQAEYGKVELKANF